MSKSKPIEDNRQKFIDAGTQHGADEGSVDAFWGGSARRSRKSQRDQAAHHPQAQTPTMVKVAILAAYGLQVVWVGASWRGVRLPASAACWLRTPKPRKRG
jgi:hypothetical protein